MGPDDEWRRPIDLMVDSDAPDQIALELARRHALYLREAQRIVIEGAVPDEGGLTAGIRAETARYLRSQPWHAVDALAPAVAAVEASTLSALTAIVARPSSIPRRPPRHRRRARSGASPSSPPRRSSATWPSASSPPSEGLELSWDAAPKVIEWVLRVSVRPDPRQDYVEGTAETLPAGIALLRGRARRDPRRIQLYGHARGGKIVRRAVISALTSGNSGAQWKRQATAS